jgi:replicative DNA helicase
VIALCQLNRESENGARRLPTLSDLRESGSIEQDADVVLLLQRGWDEDREEHSDELNVVVAKNRHGATGKFTLLWEGHFARVSDMPWG